MAFGPIDSKVATTIKDIAVIITDYYEGPGSVKYEIQVCDQYGKNMHCSIESGDLLPEMTPNQISALQTFMADLRVKAQDFLP